MHIIRAGTTSTGTFWGQFELQSNNTHLNKNMFLFLIPTKQPETVGSLVAGQGVSGLSSGVRADTLKAGTQNFSVSSLCSLAVCFLQSHGLISLLPRSSPRLNQKPEGKRTQKVRSSFLTAKFRGCFHHSHVHSPARTRSCGHPSRRCSANALGFCR